MSREIFEAQFSAQPYCLSMKKDEEGDYVSYGTKMAWEGWYAASQLTSLFVSGDCIVRRGYILRPRPGAATFIAVTITSHADSQCVVWETRHLREAYFHHYLRNFVEARLRRAFPEFVQERATYTEILTLEAESHDYDTHDDRNTSL